MRERLPPLDRLQAPSFGTPPRGPGHAGERGFSTGKRSCADGPRFGEQRGTVAQRAAVAFFAAEGSTEQYSLRVRRATEKRLDLIAFGSETADSVDALAEHLIADGVRLDREPGRPDTPGGGYGFRFSDPEGRLLEVSCYVEQRAAHCWSPASRFRSGSATW